MAESELIFDDKAKKRKKKHRLILPIIVFYSVTLSIAAFIFGRTTGVTGYYGKLIDTKIISSDIKTTASDTLAVAFKLTGTIMMPDSSPYKNGIVELDGKTCFTKTDNYGIFTIENVKPGSHKISVIQNNVVLATCNITFDGSSDTEDTAYAKQSDGSFLIDLPPQNVVVEIGMVLSGDSMTIFAVSSREETTDTAES